MKIIFIENRYKTFFFDPIAKELVNEGCEIHWLIQNKEFTPKSKKVTLHTIPYPKKNNNYAKDTFVEEVISVDRQQNHFKKKDKSYFYYYNDEISKILDRIKPDIVFGESTAFHELLIINYCKNNNILFLNPSSCRYPVGRFSFYLNDTLIPYKGSEEILNDESAEKIIDSIVNRNIVPNYMKTVKTVKKDKLWDKYIKVKSYIKGERFNTPNPIVKFVTERNKKKRIENWNLDSILEIKEDKKFKILYPLQMQPEANIDVWGKKYRNQTDLILKLSKVIPDNCILYVKPNPKSNYELTKDLLLLIESKPNIKHLHHSTKMDDILSKVDLVVTVTGTVAIECILSNKPVVTLVKTINNYAINCKYIEHIEIDLMLIINKIKSNQFDAITKKGKNNFINELNKSSFKGVVSDPFSDPKSIDKENVKNMLNAFKTIISEHQ